MNLNLSTELPASVKAPCKSPMTESSTAPEASNRLTEKEYASALQIMNKRARWIMFKMLLLALCCFLLWQAFVHHTNQYFVESIVLVSEGQNDTCMKTLIVSRLTKESANLPITYGELGDMRQRCREATKGQEINRVPDAARKEQQNALSVLTEPQVKP